MVSRNEALDFNFQFRKASQEPTFIVLVSNSVIQSSSHWLSWFIYLNNKKYLNEDCHYTTIPSRVAHSGRKSI